MNSSQAYNAITAATFTLLDRVMGAGYFEQGAQNADLQIAANLSAITDAQTAPTRFRHQNAARVAQKMNHKELRAALTRSNNQPDPIGEFTDQDIHRVVLAVNTIASSTNKGNK